VEREAKDHPSLIGNDLRHIFGGKNQEPPAHLCRRARRGRRRDPRAGGAPRPRRAVLETSRHGSPRTPTGGHEAPLSVVLFWTVLPSDSFPSRAKRSDSEAAGWLSPQANSGGRSAALWRSHPYGLPKEPLPPISRAGSSAPRVCAADKWVKSRFRKLRLFASPARVAAAADHERRSRGESRSAPIHQGR
jgi:hypothetical protein